MEGDSVKRVPIRKSHMTQGLQIAPIAALVTRWHSNSKGSAFSKLYVGLE
jgi:hypothetical protein